ncbi:signal peptidase I [Nocardioides koreensis]
MWTRTALLLVVSLVLATVLKALFVQVFYIPSESMEPGLIRNDHILVEKPSYWFGGTPQRGDVVVFADPGGWLDPTDVDAPDGALASGLARIGLRPSGGHLVKRVVGVAGDVITCCDEAGRIAVNGTPLDEDGYITPQPECNGPMTQSCQWSAGPVPEGHVFVMGDNRNHSADSTVHLCPDADAGCVPGGEYVDSDLVVGRVVARIWPGHRITLLHRPADFASVPDR